jgi:metal-dependent amidase/aminoacylase/carboxypeptidase family protein
MGGEVEIRDEEIYPPVHNDVSLLDHVSALGVELLGEENVIWSSEQNMGAEDFSFYLADQGGVPGVIFGLGIETEANAHSPHFDFGSAGLETGMLMLANLAMRSLSSSQESPMG